MNEQTKDFLQRLNYAQSYKYLERIKSIEVALQDIPLSPEQFEVLQEKYLTLLEQYGARTEYSYTIIKQLAKEKNRAIMSAGYLLYLGNEIEPHSHIVPCEEEQPNMASKHRQTYTYQDESGAYQTIRLAGDSKQDTDRAFQQFVLDGVPKKKAPTVKEFVDNTYWQNYVEPLEEKTKTSYGQMLKNNIIPFLGNKYLDQVTTTDVQQFYNWMATAASRGRKKNLNAKTIERVGALTRRIFAVAMDMGLVRDTPFKRTLLRNPGEKAGHHQALPHEVVDKVKREIPTLENDRQRLYMGLLVYTGMRKEEVLGMRWEDINLEEGFAMVKRVVVHPENNTAVVKDSPKTEHSARTVILPAPLRSILQPLAQEKGFVICGRNSEEPVNYSTFSRTYREAFKQLGITGYNNHDWRATYGTELKESGMSTALAADLMGHADERMLNTVYAPRRHEGIMAQREAVEKLNEFYTAKAE